MNGSNKRIGNVNRRSAVGMGLCLSGMVLLAWPVANQFLGAAHDPALLFVALPILTGVALMTAGFSLMVAGAEPLEGDGGEFEDAEGPDQAGH